MTARPIITSALEPGSTGEFVADQPRSLGIAAILHSLLARGLMIVINAATGILTARSLDPHGRGQLSAMTIWPLLLANAMTLGLPTSLTYKIRCQDGSAGSLIGAALVISLIISTISAAVAGLFLPQLLHLYSTEVIQYARLFLVSAPIGITLLISRAAFEAHGDFSTSTRSQWLTAAANLIGLVALRLTHSLHPVSAAFVYVLGGTPLVLWMLHKLLRIYRPSLKSFLGSSKILLSYGLRSYGIDLCGTLFAYIDQALVVGVLDAKAVGTYVVALGLSRMLSILQFSVVMVLFPTLVNRNAEEIMEMTGTATRITTLFLASIGFVVALLGPILLRLLYGKAYMGAVPVLRVLIAEVILGGTATVLSQAAMAVGRPGVVTLLQSTGLAITIPLMLVLVPKFGLIGAGYSLLISTTSRLILMVVSFRYILETSCPRLWLGRSDLVLLSDRCRELIGRTRRNHP